MESVLHNKEEKNVKWRNPSVCPGGGGGFGGDGVSALIGKNKVKPDENNSTS